MDEAQTKEELRPVRAPSKFRRFIGRSILTPSDASLKMPWMSFSLKHAPTVLLPLIQALMWFSSTLAPNSQDYNYWIHVVAAEPVPASNGWFHFSSAATRALLFSIMKWVNIFPEIKPQLISIFD
jgi:hypothetical protein